MNYSIINISEDKENPKHVICYKDLPLQYPNQFLNGKGINSGKTRCAYATTLTRFFNYFEDNYGINDYREIKLEDSMRKFMNSAIYSSVIDCNGNKKYLYDQETLITPNTANTYMNRIQVFYLTLEKPLKELIKYDSDYLERMLTEKQKNTIMQKTAYKGIWAILDLTELNIHENTKWKAKNKKKQSFTSLEAQLLVDNIRKYGLRDQCILLICLETGARITEALTICKRHFKQNSSGVWTIFISNSKTQQRYVAVPNYVAKLINSYINTDRRRITQNKSKFEYLFVSSKGNTKGNRLGYDTFLNHLKAAGEVAGMDKSHIMTHMARATKGTQMVAYGKTKEDVMRTLGNKTVINPYIDFANPELITAASEGLYYIIEH